MPRLALAIYYAGLDKLIRNLLPSLFGMMTLLKSLTRYKIKKINLVL